MYDAHEYFTGQQGLAERRFKYLTWKAGRKAYQVPHIKHMITVSDSIADLYRREYGVNPCRHKEPLPPPVDHLVPHDRSELGLRMMSYWLFSRAQA